MSRAGERPPNLTPPGTPPLHSPKSREPSDNEVCSLLHIATISGVLAALMRHFRASFASLPLLGQAIGSLPLGTWSPDSSLVRRELNGGQQVTHPCLLCSFTIVSMILSWEHYALKTLDD